MHPFESRHTTSGGLHEHVFVCPYCWESISMLLDLSAREQTYIEDCEVCCRPIQIHYTAKRGSIVQFEATRAQ